MTTSFWQGPQLCCARNSTLHASYGGLVDNQEQAHSGLWHCSTLWGRGVCGERYCLMATSFWAITNSHALAIHENMVSHFEVGCTWRTFPLDWRLSVLPCLPAPLSFEKAWRCSSLCGRGILATSPSLLKEGVKIPLPHQQLDPWHSEGAMAEDINLCSMVNDLTSLLGSHFFLRS